MNRAYTTKYWVEKIEEIMNRFDFVSVHKMMEAIEWQWLGCETIPPSVDELRKTARRILKDMVYEHATMSKGNEGCRGCGGFMAEIDVKAGWMKLYFVPTEYEVCDEFADD